MCYSHGGGNGIFDARLLTFLQEAARCNNIRAVSIERSFDIVPSFLRDKRFFRENGNGNYLENLYHIYNC